MDTRAANDDLAVPVDGLFVGAIGSLANDGGRSAIDKRAVSDARWLDVDGLAGDAQADRRVHGGPERALNHYPAEHYAAWRARYPGYEDKLVAGALGENLSTHGVTEADVYVGDVFTLGEAVIQIAQPRQPCWKPAARLGIGGLARAIAGEGRAGWLYRVLEPGHVRAGDTLTRTECAGHGITLARMWTMQTARRPSEDDRRAMLTLAELASLAPEWRKSMAHRARQLAERGG